MTAFSPEWAQAAIDRAANGFKPPNIAIDIPTPAPIPHGDRFKNKWEREYAGYLDQRKYLREILDWKYEDVGFRLADGCFFYPDFFVTFPDHFEVHEVKGRMREDALVKFKMAKEMYPFFKWVIVRKNKGEWILII